MQITDSLMLDASGLSFTRDGYLIGDAKIARAGNVQTYYGYEIGLTGEDAQKPFGVYRDPDMVFDKDAMLSLAGRPVTRGHPTGGVTAETWRDLAVGQVGGVIRKDGDHVVAPMAIMDAAAAKEVADGARSLSAGYTCLVQRDEGVAEDGTPYQFRQAGPLRFNHVAYLPENNPRAGNTRIGDGVRKQGLAPITPKKEDVMSDAFKTVVLGDKAVQVAVADVAAIEQFKADSAKALKDADAAHEAAIADKDAELAAKDAEIDGLKDKVLDGAALDAAVAARGDLIAKARAIAPDVKTDGLSDAAIRKAVVVAKLGDAIAVKADAYIDARFDILAEDAAGAGQVTDAITTIKPVRDQREQAQTSYVDRMTGRKSA